MRKDMVKMSRKEYREIIDEKNSDIQYARQQTEDALKKFHEAVGNTIELQRENGYLKALFDKEGDTQVIKYNGKLYRIVSTSHFHDECEADTLDINAVCVSEVGKYEQ